MNSTQHLHLLRHLLPGKAWTRTIALSVFVAAGAHVCLTRVPAGRIGVRQHNWGGGIEARDFMPGIYFGVRGHVSWHQLDAGTQILHFITKPEGPAGFPPLEIRTKDNNSIQVEVSVAYRIAAGQAQEIVRRGWEFSYHHHARNIVENQLRKGLASLSSEDWFDTDVRLARLAELAPVVKEAFAGVHLHCLDVSIHGVQYPPKYQDKLQETQIQYQKAKLFSAQRAVEDEKAKVGIYQEATKALVNFRRLELQRAAQEERLAHLRRMEEIETRTASYDRDVRAQAAVERDALLHEGENAVERMRASSEQERLGILNSTGGRLLLARDAARAIAIESVTLSADEPAVAALFDPNEIVGRLVGHGTE